MGTEGACAEILPRQLAASEHDNTRLEALLIERVGVRFADRGDAGTHAHGADSRRRAGPVPRCVPGMGSGKAEDLAWVPAGLVARHTELAAVAGYAGRRSLAR